MTSLSSLLFFNGFQFLEVKRELENFWLHSRCFRYSCDLFLNAIRCLGYLIYMSYHEIGHGEQTPWSNGINCAQFKCKIMLNLEKNYRIPPEAFIVREPEVKEVSRIWFRSIKTSF